MPNFGKFRARTIIVDPLRDPPTHLGRNCAVFQTFSAPPRLNSYKPCHFVSNVELKVETDSQLCSSYLAVIYHQ